MKLSFFGTKISLLLLMHSLEIKIFVLEEIIYWNTIRIYHFVFFLMNVLIYDNIDQGIFHQAQYSYFWRVNEDVVKVCRGMVCKTKPSSCYVTSIFKVQTRALFLVTLHGLFSQLDIGSLSVHLCNILSVSLFLF